jgi:leucyl aminopeptidase
LQVVDLATLTGACVVALGPSIAGKLDQILLIISGTMIFSASTMGIVDYSTLLHTKTNITSGIFTPSDELAKEITAASEISGEKFWRLPMEESYWEGMKSGVADMVNTGGRQGGSITAALFLKQVYHLITKACL